MTKNAKKINQKSTNDTQGIDPKAFVEIDKEISHAPYKSAVAIDALKIVQRYHRWVCDEHLGLLADYLDMSPAELDGIATFYNLIYRRPVGEKVISLCNSVSCWIIGSDRLEQHICQVLGIKAGQTTDDNQYTFIPVPCLGACDRAPVMMVGDELHQDLDENKIDQILLVKPKPSKQIKHSSGKGS